jgi:spore maturation protein CgeB
MHNCRLLLVGNPLDYHVGAHFRAAAEDLGWPCELVDTRKASSSNRWVNRLFYRGFSKRPARLRRFAEAVLEECRSFRPQALLSTGVAPLTADILREIGKLGVKRVNFLTDDPWNPANAAVFFWKSLRQYDVIFTPRQSNVADLQAHGCQRVKYLPFAYNPKCHFPESPVTAAELERFACDVCIIGGADKDRVPLARALVNSGFKLHLYGGYWDKFRDLKSCYRGLVHAANLRKAVAGAAVNVCMVRQANRDGHAMRSYELPAMGACMVAEDTMEHREIYGEEGVCVCYFKTAPQMVDKVKALLLHPSNRERLGGAARQNLVSRRNTYADRLQTILAST